MRPDSQPIRLRFVPAEGLRAASGKWLRRLRRATLRALCDAGCGPHVFFHAFEHEGTLYGVSSRYLPERRQVVVEVGLLPRGLRPRTISQSSVDSERPPRTPWRR